MVESTPLHSLPLQRNVIQRKDMLISACGDSIVIQKGSDAENRKKRQIFTKPIRFLLSIGDEKAIFLALSSNQIALFQMKKNMPIVMFDVDDEIIGHGEVDVKKNEEKGGEFKLRLIIPLAFLSGTMKNIRFTVIIIDSKIIKQRLKCLEEMRMEGDQMKMCVSLGSSSFFGVYEDTVVKSDGTVTRAGEPSLKKKRRVAVVGRDLWRGNMIMATENGSIRVVQVKDEEEKENESMKILTEAQCVPPYCSVRCRQPTVIISAENTVFVGTQRGEVHCLNEQLELFHKLEMEGGSINCLKMDDDNSNYLLIGFENGAFRRMQIIYHKYNESKQKIGVTGSDGEADLPVKKSKKKTNWLGWKKSETEIKCLEKGCYYETFSCHAFLFHLREKHRTNLGLAGIVFRCQCGNESVGHFHSLKCPISNFTVVRKNNLGPARTLLDKMTPRCPLCEMYPKTIYGYVDHLYREHHISLEKIGCYARCGVCGINCYTRREGKSHSTTCKSRFYTVLKIGEVGEKENETEMDQTADESMNADNRDQEME